MKIKCIICGKEFDAKKSTAKYCSDNCRNQNRRNIYQQKKEKGLLNKPTQMPIKQCLICGAEFRPKTPEANQRSCCYNCMPDGKQLKRGEFLAKIKEQKGGKCKRCGYNKCLKALEFHHLDSTKKDFTISNDHFKLKEAVKEIEKCVLLCANCHRELHDNLWNIQEIKEEKKNDIN